MNARTNQRSIYASLRPGLAVLLCVTSLAACQPSVELAPEEAKSAEARNRRPDHPGADPWKKVPRDRVAKECGLDPALLEAVEPELGTSPYAIVRYGKLCWTGGDEALLAETRNVASWTKTFGALLFGIVAARTPVDENTFVRDWWTMGEVWGDAGAAVQALPPANPNAKIFHVLTQTGHNPVLNYGLRMPWSYDAVGLRGLNSLVPIMDKVIKAYPDAFPGSTGVKDMAVNELFKPLGMTASDWPGLVTAHTLNSNVYDQAKVGLLLLRKGRWGDQQIVDEDYIYRMTHPQIEDVHTGYGYLTWLNGAAGVAPPFDVKTEPDCSPFSGWKRYPHAPTYESPNDNGGAPFMAGHDIGVFWADGAGGQMTYVHRGLDLVMVIRDDEKGQEANGAQSPNFEYHRIWRLVRPALIAMDPVYKGDEAAFCEAYRTGQYAPDLLSPWDDYSGFGSAHLYDP